MQQKYRPDIDGLRAIAVTAVVLFHAGMPGVSGGYVGVDIFFVISGFLITQIIYRATETDGFSYARFYERRIRRILPALFTLLVFASIASLTLLPYDLKQYGKSLAAVSVFLSNFIFWLVSGGYFGRLSAATPLLHTWSLAIEEQFYIFFPIVMAVLSRFGRRAVVGGILFLAAASLLASVLIQTPETDFYMPYTRAWELMCGAFVAMEIRPLASAIVSNAMTVVGVAMILAAIVLFNADMHWPGYWALVPCLGTALVIYGGLNQTVAGKILGLRPIVALGLISYSLYLWHWPLIVFASYYTLDPTWLPTVRIVSAAVSLPVAWLSWRFIERPFRERDGVMPRPALFRVAFAGSLIFLVAGTTMWATNGIPRRFPARLAMLDPERRHSHADCDGNRHCIIGAPGVSPSFAILGDSHAQALDGALDEMARRRHLSGYVFYNLGCRPFLDDIVQPSCAGRTMAAARQLKSLPLKSVILAARWDAEANRVTASRLLSSLSGIVDAAGANGARVYILIDVPRARQSVPETMQKQLILHDHADVLRTPRREYETLEKAIRSASEQLAHNGRVTILDPEPIFCPADSCDVSRDGLPLYNDAEHLGNRGGRLVVDRLIAPILAPPSG